LKIISLCWLKETSLYPPNLWCRAYFPNDHITFIEFTNNQSEAANKHMNSHFNTSKPNWKQFLEFALELEENARTKQQEEQNEIQRRRNNLNPNPPNRQENRNQNRINNEELRIALERPLSSFNVNIQVYIIIININTLLSH